MLPNPREQARLVRVDYRPTRHPSATAIMWIAHKALPPLGCYPSRQHHLPPQLQIFEDDKTSANDIRTAENGRVKDLGYAAMTTENSPCADESYSSVAHSATAFVCLRAVALVESGEDRVGGRREWRRLRMQQDGIRGSQAVSSSAFRPPPPPG